MSADILWAPWRIEYIRKTTVQGEIGDIFVDLPAENDDRKNLIAFRGETSFVMMNRFPYTNGHLLVAPYRQVGNLQGLSDAELLEINQLLAKCERWLTSIMRPNGFNIGVNIGKAAGAGIPGHIHWHVVPRWEGDVNFMSATGNVRVIPQDLGDTFDALRETISLDAR